MVMKEQKRINTIYNMRKIYDSFNQETMCDYEITKKMSFTTVDKMFSIKESVIESVIERKPITCQLCKKFIVRSQKYIQELSTISEEPERIKVLFATEKSDSEEPEKIKVLFATENSDSEIDSEFDYDSDSELKSDPEPILDFEFDYHQNIDPNLYYEYKLDNSNIIIFSTNADLIYA